MYPDEAFLPRAPEPEDIIWDGPSAPTDSTPADATVIDLSANQSDDQSTSIQEKLDEIAEGIENEAKCIEENAKNENQ